MLNIVYVLLPIFMLIALGHYFHVKKIFTDDFWSGIEHLCYYFLFPALIIRTLALTDFSKVPTLELSFTMGGAVLIMLAIVIILYIPAKAMGVSGASYSSVFQGSTRWNTFAILVIIDGFYGDIGLSIASIGVAVMIPMLNLANVTALALLVGKNTPNFKNMAFLLLKNPFIIACFVGLLINYLGVGLWQPIASVMELLGRAALALSLMAVGVGVQFTALKDTGGSVLFATILKLALMPLLMYVLASYFGLSGMSLTIAVLCGAAPTASASFILARKMGGDSQLMANIISLQTLLSILTIPAILYYIGI